MINFLGFTIGLPVGFEFLADPIISFLINILGWLGIAIATNFIILRLLRFITRRLPGEIEDIFLGIISRPIITLIVICGITISLRQLALPSVVLDWINIISISIVILVVTKMLSRLIKDIVVYYGTKWSARTETRVDDVLIPILNLFAPLILGLTAALIILPLWGINITSVLLGAGVLGLILGLALQETLGNVFSGLSLLIEAPFRKGDLVLLDDGRTCEILHLGMRSTILFSLDEQATIYMPNKLLASSKLINLTKPTPEQRYHIDVHVDPSTNLAQMQDTLLRIADGHPAVLSSNMTEKIDLVKKQSEYIRRQSARQPVGNHSQVLLLEEAAKNEGSIPKLELEGELNHHILKLKELLRELIRGISSREIQGLTEVERQELFCNFLSPAETSLLETMSNAQVWVEKQDPWVNDTDYWQQRKLWEFRNEQLRIKWERLKKIIYQKTNRNEMRLDDYTKQILEWLEKEYKLPPGYWKNPNIGYKNFDNSGTHLQLWYYVDNIRLEHDSRPQRVRAELSRLIQEQLTDVDA